MCPGEDGIEEEEEGDEEKGNTSQAPLHFPFSFINDQFQALSCFISIHTGDTQWECQ